MSLKKILVILIILLVVVIGALVVYNFLIKEPTPPDEEPSDSSQIPISDSTSDQTGGSSYQKRLKAISQEPVMNPFTDGKTIKYYSTSNGNVFESDLDGSNLNRISSVVLTDLIKVLWSANGDKVIAIFDENGRAKKYLYDYQTKVSTALNDNIQWIGWSPNEDRYAYQYYNPITEDNNISIGQADTLDWTNILQTRMKDLIVEWPDSGKVAVRTKPSGLAQSVVYTINLANGDFQKIIAETYGLTLNWSPLGNKLLYSETNDQGKDLELKIADLETSALTELDIVTLPEKCVWSQDNRTIFCAVPKSIPQAAVLPDDYYKRKISFSDDFWRINTETGEANMIYEAKDSEASAYNAKDLLLPPLEDYLLFVNQKNGLLYSLKL